MERKEYARYSREAGRLMAISRRYYKPPSATTKFTELMTCKNRVVFANENNYHWRNFDSTFL